MLKRVGTLALMLGVLSGVATAAAPRDIVQTAAGASQFSTLTRALEAAGLTGALEGKGPFTVFAPTDAAFAKLPAGTLETLLKPENRDKLRSSCCITWWPGGWMLRPWSTCIPRRRWKARG